jgi:hypothetical protein
MTTTFAVKARQDTRTPFGSPLEPDVNLQESGAVRRQSRGRNHPLGLPTGSQCRIDCRNLSGHVGWASPIRANSADSALTTTSPGLAAAKIPDM